MSSQIRNTRASQMKPYIEEESPIQIKGAKFPEMSLVPTSSILSASLQDLAGSYALTSSHTTELLAPIWYSRVNKDKNV